MLQTSCIGNFSGTQKQNLNSLLNKTCHPGACPIPVSIYSSLVSLVNMSSVHQYSATIFKLFLPSDKIHLSLSKCINETLDNAAEKAHSIVITYPDIGFSFAYATSNERPQTILVMYPRTDTGYCHLRSLRVKVVETNRTQYFALNYS
jgi:hypothetical protein